MDWLKVLHISKRFRSVKDFPQWVLELGAWNIQMKTLRTTLMMTQRQLGKRMKTTQFKVNCLEKEGANPTLNMMRRAADALNCELIVSFIPKEEIAKTIDKRAKEKAETVLRDSIGNAAMELQKPGEEVIEHSKKELESYLKGKGKRTLWED